MKAALAVIKLLARNVKDAQTIRETAAALCRARFPNMEDKDIYMPFTAVNSAYKIRIHPDDAQFMIDVSIALMSQKENAEAVTPAR